MPRYYVEYTRNFVGGYGGEWIEADEEPDGWELEEMAIQHFPQWARSPKLKMTRKSDG